MAPSLVLSWSTAILRSFSIFKNGIIPPAALMLPSITPPLALTLVQSYPQPVPYLDPIAWDLYVSNIPIKSSGVEPTAQENSYP